MRVVIAAESFIPQVNGVTNSVLRVLEHLRATGHEALVIAPSDEATPTSYAGFPVVTVPSIGLPGYQDVRVGLTASFLVTKVLADFAPDVLHAAAPFSIGSAALLSAARLHVPSVAIYQTDIPSYVARYGLPRMESLAWSRLRAIHSAAGVTLAPSTFACNQLRDHGVPRVELWGRGVDTTRFSPTKRDPQLHRRWAPDGEVVIGYMGRLAMEKQVSDLTAVADLPHTRLVVIGDGPTRKALSAELPQAVFTGGLAGEELARATATIDVFIHPGELETFGQAIQEALACGVPVVAPARGGPTDLIDSGRWGRLYAPGDLTQMRHQVEHLVADESARRRFGSAGRAFTLERTWPRVCDQLLDHYRAVIAHAETAARRS